METKRIFAVAAICMAAPFAVGGTGQLYVLRYDRPAAEWTEALPIGNGRLGAMVYGQLRVERIILNEDTLCLSTMNGTAVTSNPSY